ncbi:hypothetical protein LCGC14_1352440 [marine sediment metagenome]|uniref:Uncharacterized protein n=1 Tax=marine sediment metagenome TaxID=412755 RepID=A0A0F9KB69_9ZZZZ
MIYLTKVPDILKQGDILQNLPKITPNQIDFDKVKENWLNSLESAKLPKKANYIVKPSLANGVILSQSCDIRSGFSILFAELKNLPINRLSSKDLEKRIKGIKNIIRDDTRAHYFPPSNEIELFKEPKLIDFKSLFLLPYKFFEENLEKYFVARLINEAQKVLCEKVSRFFTRFAYEDIIFLTNKEIDVYLESISDEDKNIANQTLDKIRNRSKLISQD